MSASAAYKRPRQGSPVPGPGPVNIQPYPPLASEGHGTAAGGAYSATSPAVSVSGSGSKTTASSFRNVSACNRCRNRKNRCDQNLPACSACEKAKVKCVGWDPVLNREIPRAYVYYLEGRVSYLEGVLSERRISFRQAEDFDLGTKPLIVNHGSHDDQQHDATGGNRQRRATNDSSTHSSEGDLRSPASSHGGVGPTSAPRPTETRQSGNGVNAKQEEDDFVNEVSRVGLQGTSDNRYLGEPAGITFARVVFGAIQESIPGSNSPAGGSLRRPSMRPPSRSPSTGKAGFTAPSMRENFFGLQTKTAYRPAKFPSRSLGEKLMGLYFEHANPQIPILHRGEFHALFERAYTEDPSRRRGSRELYLLNIVFAIGAGIIWKSDRPDENEKSDGNGPSRKRARADNDNSDIQRQPEEYHASAMEHLEFFLREGPASEIPEGFGGSLEELQAVLLLASFALLRPVAPGLWYIVGVAMRLAVDLGLHCEDRTELTSPAVATYPTGRVSRRSSSMIGQEEMGRRTWVRDLRRRLWWCVYNFDRIVSTCVGRPFGINDQVITTPFPSLLDDKYITQAGLTVPEVAYSEPSYKRVAHHYLKLRLLQSEMLQVILTKQARIVRDKAYNDLDAHMKKINSPYLAGFKSFEEWRQDIDRRLFEWKTSAPRQEDTTVQFSVQFLELNYWQAIVMLYRQSLSTPAEFQGEVSPSDEVVSPIRRALEPDLSKEANDEVYLKVAVAGQKVLMLYRQLHRVKLVNYTFLATHHLFMAGIAFLYALWCSPKVRMKLTLDDVDYTILAGKSVLSDLVSKCPPAEACKTAFDRMARTTVRMCLSNGGLGVRARHNAAMTKSPAPGKHQSMDEAIIHGHNEYIGLRQGERNPIYSFATKSPPPKSNGQKAPARPKFQFDENLSDLFPEGILQSETVRPTPNRQNTTSLYSSDVSQIRSDSPGTTSQSTITGPAAPKQGPLTAQVTRPSAGNTQALANDPYPSAPPKFNVVNYAGATMPGATPASTNNQNSLQIPLEATPGFLPADQTPYSNFSTDAFDPNAMFDSYDQMFSGFDSNLIDQTDGIGLDLMEPYGFSGFGLLGTGFLGNGMLGGGFGPEPSLDGSVPELNAGGSAQSDMMDMSNEDMS